MEPSPEPPPIQSDSNTAPPVSSDPVSPPPPKPKNPLQKAWGAFIAALAMIWKFLFPIFKLAKGSKILLTSGTMLLSVWVYSQMFGIWFALGFVICIFIHEMGHVFAAWRLGFDVSAPIFIPFFGALILTKRAQGSAFEQAVMGYGGPAFGALSAVGCWALYAATGNLLFLGLAYTAFFLNLFNMLPVFPLDGGWITGAVSPYLWIAGFVGLIALFVAGIIHNPFIIVLVIFAFPRIVGALKSGSMDTGEQRTTSQQRLGMGLAYVALCAFLVWGMTKTHDITLVELKARRVQAIQ